MPNFVQCTSHVTDAFGAFRYKYVYKHSIRAVPALRLSVKLLTGLLPSVLVQVTSIIAGMFITR